MGKHTKRHENVTEQTNTSAFAATREKSKVFIFLILVYDCIKDNTFSRYFN